MFTLYSAPKSFLGFHPSFRKPQPPSIKLLNLRPNGLPQLSNFRPKVVAGLQVKQRLAPIFSTSPNSSEGDSLTEKSAGTKASEESNSQGPPILTILAGFIVLFLVFKVFGSIIAWLVGLIVNVPKPK